MSAFTFITFFSFALSALAVRLQGPPTLSNVLPDKVKPMINGNLQNVPDGKFLSFRVDPKDKSKGYIINLTPNYFMTSSSSYLEDVTGPREIGKVKDALTDDAFHFVIIPETLPIPDKSVTGLRGNGSLYDQGSIWLFGAYRLSETSQPDAPEDAMIGFEHNEDYWGDSKCTYKSIGVRYSQDAGRSWTRSVPIITTGIQTETCDMNHQFSGSGDFAPVWNHKAQEWTILSPDDSLSMKVSKDPLAKPGSWTRLEPVSGQKAAGFIGPGDSSLVHQDLKPIAGSSPSILFDKVNDCWHMVYGKWGGGIVYTKSVDLQRWDEPFMLIDTEKQPASKYPTLLGNEGDSLTTDGTARLYFGADNPVAFGRALWVVDVDFGNSGHVPSSTSGNETETDTNTAPLEARPTVKASTSGNEPETDTNTAPLAARPTVKASTSGNEPEIDTNTAPLAARPTVKGANFRHQTSTETATVKESLAESTLSSSDHATVTVPSSSQQFSPIQTSDTKDVASTMQVAHQSAAHDAVDNAVDAKHVTDVGVDADNDDDEDEDDYCEL